MDNPVGFDLRNKSAHISSLNKTPASIVQEYAAKNKLVPQYDLIYNGISQSKVTFRYSLTLDDYTTVGEGASKKEAKHVAALKILKLMINDNPHLLKTEFKQWDFENHVVSPFDDNIKVNAVGQLNDICTNHKLGLPVFELVREEGQAHAKLFTISCQVAKMIETATHKTKKQAKHFAAVQMVNKLKCMDKSLAPELETNKTYDSIKVLEQVEVIKSVKVKLNAPMDEHITNYHLLFKNHEWPETAGLDALLQQYLSNDCDLNIDDPVGVLNNIAEECEMNLTFRIMDKSVIVDAENLHCVLSIDNIYPPVCSVGMAKNANEAKEKAAFQLLKNICVLYK
ncbi:Double-stranded RNA-binding domain [Cinara cedri]|uniref:Double-stranded RNA-binding domain n=1 Tax=Cinara cedri TaxID=506608 RepID=A0A5E4MEH5_9HEMI|nr:Double-stranded RNA-binding domain [Cinara cedri]